VQARANARPVVVLRDAEQLSAPRWTADGLSLVVGARLDSIRSGLFVVPRLGGVPRPLPWAGPFDTHATADSLLVVQPDARSGQQVAHVVSIATGERGDSVALGVRPVHGVGWSPDGSRIAMLVNYASLTIARRDGALTDSVASSFRTTVRWTPDGSAVLAFVALPVKEDNLERIAVDADGRLGQRSVVLQRVPGLLLGQFDVARRAGRLAYMAGSLTMDLWTFDLPPARAAASQRTSGTTWYSIPAIAPDGERLYYQRGDALGDNLHQLSLPDAEEALRDGRAPGGSDVRISRDGRRAVFSQMEESGPMLIEMDVASRRSRSMPWPTTIRQTPIPIGDRTFAYVAESAREIVVVDSVGGAARTVAVPDSVMILSMTVGPGDRDAAFLVETGGTLRLGISPLAEWRFTELQRFGRAELPWLAGWTDDGWIHLASERGIGEPAVLSRLRADQPRPVELLMLPRGCLARSTSVATAAPRGTCRVDDPRGDIWLADVPDAMR
jgi:dipeptidyl aminopeptidase/acylaminoacyl peptidase